MDKIYILWTFGISETDKLAHPRHFQAVFTSAATAEIRAEAMSWNLCRELLAWTTDSEGDSKAANRFIEYMVTGHELVKSATERAVDKNRAEATNKRIATHLLETIEKKTTQQAKITDPDLWTESEWKQAKDGYELYTDASNANPGANIYWNETTKKWYANTNNENESDWSKCKRENPDKVIKWDYEHNKWVAISEEEAANWSPSKETLSRVQDAITIPASNPPSDSGKPASPSVQVSGTPWKPNAS